MLCCSFRDQQNGSKLFLKLGQEVKDVMFSLAGQKSVVFCYTQGRPATGAISVRVYAVQFLSPPLKQSMLILGLFYKHTSLVQDS